MTDEYTQAILKHIEVQKRENRSLRSPSLDGMQLFAIAIGAGYKTLEADAFATQQLLRLQQADAKSRQTIVRGMAENAKETGIEGLTDVLITQSLITKSFNSIIRSIQAKDKSEITAFIVNLFNTVHPPTQFLDFDTLNESE
jgi:hypothetical protein